MITLLNCPFCGSNNVKYQYTCGAGYVTCENCESYGAMIRSEENDVKRMQKAIEKWNTRLTQEFYMTKSEDTPQKHFRYSKCLRCKTENRHSLNLRNTDMLHLIRDKEESPIKYEFCKRCKLLTRQITVAFTEVKL